MTTPKYLLFTAVLFAGIAHAEDGHFSLPPTSPVAVGNAGSFTGSNDRAPEGCDANALLAWMKSWRERARIGYVNGVVKYMPSITPGASCIKGPEAYDVQYMKNGDYFMATCLAQKSGTLSHLFRMDIVVTPAACLSDARFAEYVRGTQCKMPGGNQRFLDEVMKPCPITPPNSPVLRGPPVAYAIDVNYFNRLLNDRPEIRNIVDESRKVKVGPSGPGPGCNSPFGCDASPASVDGNSREVK